MNCFKCVNVFVFNVKQHSLHYCNYILKEREKKKCLAAMETVAVALAASVAAAVQDARCMLIWVRRGASTL